MNNLKYILCLLFITGLTFSCQEDLELFPENSKIPAFDRLSDFQEALVGTYNSFQGGGAYAKNLLTLDCWVGDDMNISSRSLGDGSFLHQWQYAADDNDMSATWSRLYTTILRANNVILNRNNIDDPEVNQLVGEALGIRALCHLELYKIYGDRYQNGNSLGVPFSNSLDIESKPARLTSGEVLDLIENDIIDALSLISSQFNNTLINQIFLNGLLARIAVHRSDWNAVVNYTTQVINEGPALASIANYPAIWDGSEADHESIFKVVFLPGDATVGGAFWNVEQQVAFFNPSAGIIDALKEFGGKDVRLNAFVNEADERVTKYIGAPGNFNLAHVKVMRTSEMYLLRAEAYTELGQKADAQVDLDAIRMNRIPGYTSTPEVDMLGAVLHERRKELCFEGFRVFDLKRRNLPIQRGSDCIQDRCALPANDFRMIYPIPQDEVFANDNMIQNPGY